MNSRPRLWPHAAMAALAVAPTVACQPIEYDHPADQALTTSAEGPNNPLGELTQAITASGPQANLIRTVHQHTLELSLYRAYFEQRLQDAPQWTPDGHGAFQFFQGDVGVGAIYSHEYETGDGTRPITASPIYGAILPAWAGWGFETVLGYPNSEEHDASDRSAQTPCASEGGTRQQVFGNVRWDGPNGGGASEVVLCWSPERGVWVLPLR